MFELFFANHLLLFFAKVLIAKKASSESGTGLVKNENLVAPEKTNPEINFRDLVYNYLVFNFLYFI